MTSESSTTSGGSTATSADGALIVRADIVGTIVFTITAVYAAVVFDTTAQWVGAITAISLFFIGIAAFLWSFCNAVQRSRGEQVAVTQLYFLAGGVAPRQVRRTMLLALTAQSVVGLATALARTTGDDGTPGTSLALGVLVPVFGFGLNGLWAAYHGTYAVRTLDEPADDRARRTERPTSSRASTQEEEEEHG
ncbi:MAG: hypothetical protein AAGF91_13360 [Actinomycetota bacterium]